jgi:hypothetical protein
MNFNSTQRKPILSTPQNLVLRAKIKNTIAKIEAVTEAKQRTDEFIQWMDALYYEGAAQRMAEENPEAYSFHFLEFLNA